MHAEAYEQQTNSYLHFPVTALHTSLSGTHSRRPAGLPHVPKWDTIERRGLGKRESCFQIVVQALHPMLHIEPRIQMWRRRSCASEIGMWICKSGVVFQSVDRRRRE